MVDCAALLLRGHAGVGLHAFLLGAGRERALVLGLRLGNGRRIALLGWRGASVLRLLLGLLVHLALLELWLCVGVLVVGGRLLLGVRHVGRLGVLVHGDCGIVSYMHQSVNALLSRDASMAVRPYCADAIVRFERFVLTALLLHCDGTSGAGV